MRLRGHEARPAAVELEYRPARVWMIRGLLVLFGSWLLAPLAFLLPPHLPWGLGVLIGGAWLAYRQWAGEFVVLSFSAQCPRCGSQLEIGTGTRIRLPHDIDCFNCHHEPTLVVEGSAG